MSARRRRRGRSRGSAQFSLSPLCARHAVARLLPPPLALRVYQEGCRRLGDVPPAMEFLAQSLGSAEIELITSMLRLHAEQPCDSETSAEVGRRDGGTERPSIDSASASAHFELPSCPHLDQDLDDWDGVDWAGWMGADTGGSWCPLRMQGHRHYSESNLLLIGETARTNEAQAAVASLRQEFRAVLGDAISRILSDHGRPLHYHLITAVLADQWPHLRAPEATVYAVAASEPRVRRVGPGVFARSRDAQE